jgi:hypothetical protein
MMSKTERLAVAHAVAGTARDGRANSVYRVPLGADAALMSIVVCGGVASDLGGVVEDEAEGEPEAGTDHRHACAALVRPTSHAWIPQVALEW